MTYNPNIPQVGDDPSQSQGQILTNFSEINTRFGTDHVQFNDATPADRGEHLQVTLNTFKADPTLSYPKSQIYTKVHGLTPNQNQIAYVDVTNESGVNQIVPIHPLAFGVFSNAGVIALSFNVSSVGQAGNIYTINFTRPLPNANYTCVVSSQSVSGPSIVIQVRTPSTTAVVLVTTNTSDVASQSFANLHFIIYGTI